MKRSPLLHLVLILSGSLAILHFLFSKLSLYWTVWWADNFLHFLGGVTIACLGVWIFYVSMRKIPGSRLRSFLTILVFVLIVGIGWEVFEYVFGIAGSTEEYGMDTFHDLVADSVGAGIGWLIGTSKKYIL